MTLAELPPVLNTNEVCDLLRISRGTLRKEIEAGRVPAFRVGAHYRFSRAAILRYLGERELAPLPPTGMRH